MAVRIVLPNGETTTFTYATSAVSSGGNVGIFEWNDQHRDLEEIANLRLDAFVRIEVIKDRVVIQTIAGRAHPAARLGF
jgi:hypothetical protein